MAGGAHQVHGLLQVLDGLVNLIVDDGHVEVVGVGLLQDLRLFLQPLERLILEEEERNGEVSPSRRQRVRQA